MLDNFNCINDTELQEVNGGATGYNGPCFVYVVKKGDNLINIAKKYKTTVDILVAINKISNPDLIFVNQKLLVPYQA